MSHVNVASEILSIARHSSAGRMEAEPMASTVSFAYLRLMTDDTGMIQHGLGGIPDAATGYTTDDNARAFLAMVRFWRMHPDRREEVEPLLRRYLQFLGWVQHRTGPHTGWFVNFVSYDRRFLDEAGTEDCLGRCLWALGEAASGPLPSGCALLVHQLFYRALPHAGGLVSPRAIAYSLLGLCRALPQDSILLHSLAEKLARLWREYSTEQWQWFEPYMTYDNARLAEAMHRAAAVLENAEYRQIAEQATAFLTEHSFSHGYLEPVGNRGWWPAEDSKAIFDQQTIEAGAYAELYRLTGDAAKEKLSLRWYIGQNVHGIPIYDRSTGGCFDALTINGVNRNQGAESILSLLLALP